jgi:hypothetical protein
MFWIAVWRADSACSIGRGCALVLETGRIPDPTNDIKSRQQTDNRPVLKKSCPRGLDFNSLAFFEGYPAKNTPQRILPAFTV